jgi:hypothetical protein
MHVCIATGRLELRRPPTVRPRVFAPLPRRCGPAFKVRDLGLGAVILDTNCDEYPLRVAQAQLVGEPPVKGADYAALTRVIRPSFLLGSTSCTLSAPRISALRPQAAPPSRRGHHSDRKFLREAMRVTR